MKDFEAEERVKTHMLYRHVGKCGLQVSEVGLGTMTFGAQVSEKNAFLMMDQAFFSGVNLFDCADIYPLNGGIEKAGITEKIVGKWMKTKKRDEIIVTSKCFAKVQDHVNGLGLSRAHILSAINQSLKNLQTDYVDIYMAHSFDETVPLEETLRAFEDIVSQGKVRYIGVSNWSSWQMEKALRIAETKNYLPVCADELRYNILFRRPETEIMPMLQSEGLGAFSYNPLAGGLLTGRYSFHKMPDGNDRFNVDVGGPLYHVRYWNEQCFSAVEKYLGLCKQWELDPVQAAIKWVLSKPGISSVLLGASNPEQLTGTLCAPNLLLSDEQVNMFDELWYLLPRYKQEPVH